jgi:hypothetical protein
LPYPQPDRLVVICEQHPSLAGFCVGSPPNAADWLARTRSSSALGLSHDRACGVVAAGLPAARAARTDPATLLRAE